MPFAIAVLNPFASASTLYSPGFRLVATYTPALFVVRVMATFVFTFVIRTVAPGITAPLVSTTIPLIVPNSPCARIFGEQKAKMERNPANTAAILACLTAPSRIEARASEFIKFRTSFCEPRNPPVCSQDKRNPSIRLLHQTALYSCYFQTFVKYFFRTRAEDDFWANAFANLHPFVPTPRWPLGSLANSNRWARPFPGGGKTPRA